MSRAILSAALVLLFAGGITSVSVPAPAAAQSAICGILVRDGSANGMARYRATRMGSVVVNTSDNGRIVTRMWVNMKAGDYVLLKSNQGISCRM